jgi:CRISPR/Cas system CMR-associated protein Cmr1 (group 7 of RAMP superfamily)
MQLPHNGTCNNCDEGIQANNHNCKYASFYHVFHNIKFNTLKKGKHWPEGNSVIHELTNEWDEMWKWRVENNLVSVAYLLCDPYDQKIGNQGHDGSRGAKGVFESAIKRLTKKIKNVSFPEIALQKDNVVTFC